MQLEQSDSWRRCQKRNYAVLIERLLNAVERSGDIGRWIAALALPISDRPRVTSHYTGKLGLGEPSKHTASPNLPPRNNVGHDQTYK